MGGKAKAVGPGVRVVHVLKDAQHEIARIVSIPAQLGQPSRLVVEVFGGRDLLGGERWLPLERVDLLEQSVVVDLLARELVSALAAGEAAR